MRCDEEDSKYVLTIISLNAKKKEFCAKVGAIHVSELCSILVRLFICDIY